MTPSSQLALGSQRQGATIHWNFVFVSATVLLTRSLWPAERFHLWCQDRTLSGMPLSSGVGIATLWPGQGLNLEPTGEESVGLVSRKVGTLPCSLLLIVDQSMPTQIAVQRRISRTSSRGLRGLAADQPTP